ncbi:hypothetical protein OH146_00640 [Salinibacterium sp. SYSU T00001]|uniref:hypothetical protein n=1 Tax=Homoserinimonas sedimenticola TaxID=2986805 RepID=UPI002235CAF0|nr:hypothetical protein [Salinibacterium sedimenticola]MCW4384277.1 hypothetical protein [Salinibacterium sedimenticola]
MSWHDDWRGLRVAVLGLDARGFAVADTLLELGADVTVLSPGGHTQDREELLSVIGGRLRLIPADSDAVSVLQAIEPEVAVVTADFGPRHPLVAAVRGETAVVSELELAWRLRDKVGEPAPWLLVTGGEGAGSTAHLAEAMLLAAGRRVMACGATEAGVPVLDAIRVPEGWECVVIAASGDDLHFATSVSAVAAACLSSEGQRGADSDLARVYTNAQVACVYNRDDEETMHMVEEAEVIEGCRAIGFGLGIPGPSDFGVVEGILCDRAFLEERHASALEFATVDLLGSAGLATGEGVARVLAAAALARSVGVPVSALNAALRGLGPALG